MNRVQRKLTGADATIAQKLDREIEALEKGEDVNSVFNTDQLMILNGMGQASYLAHLKRVRLSLEMGDFGE